MTRYTHYSLLTLLISSFASSVNSASIPALCKKGGQFVQNCSSEIDITCSLDKTGEDCDSYFERMFDCETIDVIIKYQYCNCNTGNGENIVVFPQRTYGLYKSQPVITGDDVKELQPSTCDIIEIKKRVNTCQGFAKAEMSWNGYNKKYGISNSVCYAFDRDHWDFPRPTTSPTPAPTVTVTQKSVPTAPNPDICKLQILCLLEDGSPCIDGVIRQSASCGFIPATMVLKYCNTHDSLTLNLNQDIDKSFIKLNQVNFLDMDKSPIPPEDCHEQVIHEYLDTCRDNNIIQARVEGKFEGSTENEWCVATDTLEIDTIVTPPTSPPTPKGQSGKGKGKGGKGIRR